MVCYLEKELLIFKDQVKYYLIIDYVIDHKNKIGALISYGSEGYNIFKKK
jgi:hypothetical protein